jgi:hypothetical protein
LWRECLLAGADLRFRVASGLNLLVIRVYPSEIAMQKGRSSGFKVPLEVASDTRNATHIPRRASRHGGRRGGRW